MTINRTFGVGIDNQKPNVSDKKRIQYINLKLAANGYPTSSSAKSDFIDMAKPLLHNYNIKARLLETSTSPLSKRILTFLENYLNDVPGDNSINFPKYPFILDTHGIARMISIPPDADFYETDFIKTYRTAQGILNNPKSDRRTTKGVFHVCEGGLPIADDKKAVPKVAFCRLLQAALNPPKELMQLPFTANEETPAELFVSLMLRPIVVPEVPGVSKEKSMEVRFLAPGSLVANLDFVESIFGNAGDPFLPENDAALDPESWTGHTGCVILAPHLTELTKKELGLPYIDDATDRQKRDGMCWEKEDEKYNNGSAFKITVRDESGVVVTLISDNYFGYCKKEVKTMIGYSANLFGLAEEEHAGGAMASPSYNLGEKFYIDEKLPTNSLDFASFLKMYGDMLEIKEEGFAVDKTHPEIIYIPEDAQFDLLKQSITWNNSGKQGIKLLPYKHYIYPSGYKVEMKKRIEGPKWHLVGTVAEGTLCHKPCTVSGGGKSEISKSLKDAMIQGSVIINDLNKDLDMVEEVMAYDFSKRFKVPADYSKNPPRHILSPNRSLGSVIKLLTPSELYTDEYNKFLTSFPQRIKVLIYVIKGNFPEMQDTDWRKYFSVDQINGVPGYELKFQNNKLLSNYLRVGHDIDGSWRIFLLRQDFNPSAKVQAEDDITSSIVLDAGKLDDLNPEYANGKSVKIIKNCESRLFQRPDDCVYKGYDKQAEADLSSPYTFLSNFEPLTRKQVQEIKDDTIGFELYTQPVKDLINKFLKSDCPDYLVIPSEPRIVDGKPTKNQRYLQTRPDLVDDTDKYVAEICTRIYRKIPLDKPVIMPVNAVLPGRRNNPAEPENNVPPLAVYNPIHYQELPELFIDFICSITGKSPSTTGFGSEGALTKGPFNSLLPATDLNNAFLSYILTGYDGFSSAAGYVGPKYKVDHDVSLLIPEIWCRMSVEERDPKYLIENGYLEKVEDFEYNGKTVDASLLGYRITLKFVRNFMARIFSKPDAVFCDEMLHPEKQDMDMFVASIENLSITQKRVAEGYMKDGTIDRLCPPLKALIHIMIDGKYKGHDRSSAEVRELFTRESVLNSDWYKDRLVAKQKRDIDQWTNNIKYLENLMSNQNFAETTASLNLASRLANAKEILAKVTSEEYIEYLKGTIGLDTLQPIEG